MIKNTLIIALILALIYLYYQNRKLKGLSITSDGSQTIFELDEDLMADRDSAIRAKKEAEQEALSLSNKLKLKQQEVTRKESEITRLKEEKSQVEIALNEKIKELKTSLLTQEKKTSQMVVGFSLFLSELEEFIAEEPFKKDKVTRASERVRNLIDNHD